VTLQDIPEAKEGWKLRGEGEIHKKGETLTVQCLPSDLPVWFEAV
jgi:hypothetical protein